MSEPFLSSLLKRPGTSSLFSSDRLSVVSSQNTASASPECATVFRSPPSNLIESRVGELPVAVLGHINRLRAASSAGICAKQSRGHQAGSISRKACPAHSNWGNGFLTSIRRFGLGLATQPGKGASMGAFSHEAEHGRELGPGVDLAPAVCPL